MKTILIALLLCFGLSVNATPLQCKISLNLKQVHSQTVESRLADKIPIGHSQGISAYVTEKAESSFLVEAFLEEEQVRIYGQGPLKNSGETVSASFWSRNTLADISCTKL